VFFPPPGKGVDGVVYVLRVAGAGGKIAVFNNKVVV